MARTESAMPDPTTPDFIVHIEKQEGVEYAIYIRPHRPLTDSEMIRMKHHLKLRIAAVARSYFTQVMSWTEREAALWKLTGREARLLNVFPDWKQAQQTKLPTKEKK